MKFKDRGTEGFALALGAFIIWGVFPIYFKFFDQSVTAIEILIHRIIWSVVFMAILLKFANKFQNIKKLLLRKNTRNFLALSGLMISINWGIYIYAVDTGRILEASLGYFMNPLMNILIGFLIFKETPSFAGKIAIFIVFLAISVQIYYAGGLPVISLILPASFAVYVAIRKFINIAALDGLFIETLMVLPFALLYFIYLIFSAKSHFEFGLNAYLMIFSGVVTVLPLMMFNAATTRMKLSTLGYIQYLSPTLTMLIAVLVYDENLPSYKLASFALIWLAILLVSLENLVIKIKRR